MSETVGYCDCWERLVKIEFDEQTGAIYEYCDYCGFDIESGSLSKSERLTNELTALRDAARAVADMCQTFMTGDVLHRVFEPDALATLRGLLDSEETE